MTDSPERRQEEAVATFIARLIYCGMSTESAVEQGYRYALAMLKSDERVSTPDLPETMRKASFLLSGAMPEVPKWVAAWQLNEQKGEEDRQVKEKNHTHKLEHLLQSYVDFVENPTIAGDAISIYATSLHKRARDLLGYEDD